MTYFEGYLWDPPRAKEAIRLTAEIAHEAGREVSMTLSDPFCVDRYRGEFLDLMRSQTVDIVFANESELKSLYQTASFEAALDAIRKDCKLAAVTRSEKGSVIVTRERDRRGPGDRDRGTGRHHRGRRPLRRRVPVSATPAGATWRIAAGWARWRPDSCIQQIGPRPRQNLKHEAEQAGLG